MLFRSGDNLFRYPCKLDAYVVALCVKGYAVGNINLNEFEIKPNLLIFNFPENIIQIKDYTDDFGMLVIILGNKFLKSLHIDLVNLFPMFMEMKNRPSFELSNTQRDTLIEFYKMLLKSAASTEDKYHKEIIRQLISAFIYKACSMLFNDELTNHTPGPVLKGRREQLFARFMELVASHHRKERSVGFYASELSITPKYLSTLIKQVSSKTAAEWIDEYVILEAKALLKYSDKSIQEIAYHLNFPTQSFFGKYFKHHTGMSPSRYKAIGSE